MKNQSRQHSADCSDAVSCDQRAVASEVGTLAADSTRNPACEEAHPIAACCNLVPSSQRTSGRRGLSSSRTKWATAEVIRLSIPLAGTVNATVDPKRKYFYEIDGGPTVYYIYVSPLSGKISLSRQLGECSEPRV
jgi:hypothetical protein